MRIKVSVRVTSQFKRRAKPLLKKFPSLHHDLLSLQESLLENPFQGIDLGKNVFKIRLRITSKGKGKSGGGRVITFVETDLVYTVDEQRQKTHTVNLVTIYDKGETSTITDKEIQFMIENISFDE